MNCVFMVISKNILKNIAKSFLEVIEAEKISSIPDLERNLKKRFSVPQSKDYVYIGMRPSELNTEAYTVTYRLSLTQEIPIEFKANTKLGYSMIIIKCLNKISGYQPFSVDIDGNIIQSATFLHTDIPELKGEIKNLENML